MKVNKWFWKNRGSIASIAEIANYVFGLKRISLKCHDSATFGHMNKAELMIGNLIVYKDQVRVVESIGANELSLQSIAENVDLATNPIHVAKDEECSGIPLNEGWLQALGLTADPENAVYEELWYNFPDERYSIKLNTLAPHKVELEYIVILKMVSFVHELQNLYFIITGNHLQVSSYRYGVYARG